MLPIKKNSHASIHLILFHIFHEERYLLPIPTYIGMIGSDAFAGHLISLNKKNYVEFSTI